MPGLNGILQPEGALVAVTIGLSQLEVQRRRRAARAIPAAVTLQALLDTGAECSCVDPRAVVMLGLPLKTIGLANLPAAGGLVAAAELEASLIVVHPSGDPRLNLVVNDLALTEVGLAALGYEVLIGRDVLGRCRFLYDGQGGRFELDY